MPSNQYLKKSFQLDKQLANKLKKKAEEEKTSESTIIRKAINQYIK